MPDPHEALHGFTLVLPASWAALDLEPKSRDRSLERTVRRAVGGGDDLARVRREVVAAYKTMIEDATAHGAFLAASFSDTGGKLPMTASLVAFLVPIPVDDEGLPYTLGKLKAALAEPGPDEQIVEHTMADLALGDAVRLRALVRSEAAGTDGRHPQLDVLRYFVPWGGGLFILAFSTPTLFAADAFVELFDAIASSARWRPRPAS